MKKRIAAIICVALLVVTATQTTFAAEGYHFGHHGWPVFPGFPGHKHHFVEKVTEPTCTEEGYTTYTCKDCGNVWVDDTVVANGHKFTALSTKTDYKRIDNNCTTALTYWFKCSDCDVSAETANNGEVDEATLYWVK